MIMTQKESGSWVNYHSKELRVSVATYNAEGDAFSVTRLTSSFLDTGVMQLKASTDSIPRARRDETLRACHRLPRRRGLHVLPGAPRKELARQANKPTPSFVQHAVSAAFSLVMFIVEFGAIPVFFALLIQALTMNFDTELSWIADAADSQDKLQALQGTS